MGKFKISDDAKDKGKEKESKKSKAPRLESRKDRKGKEKLKEKAVPAEYGAVAEKRKAVQAEAAAQSRIAHGVKTVHENHPILSPYPGSMTALRQYEENCSQKIRRFGLLRAVATSKADKSVKTDLHQVRKDLDRDVFPYATKMSANQKTLPPGITQEQLDQLLNTLAVGYTQGTGDLLTYLSIGFTEKQLQEFKEGRFQEFQIVIAGSKLYSGSIFPRDPMTSAANLVTLSSGFEIAYMDGDDRASLTIPGEYFFTAKTHPEGGFEILSYHSSNALLKAILEYTPIRNEKDEIVYYPPLTVYGIQIVDKNQKFSLENLNAAILEAEKEEQRATNILESDLLKFRAYYTVLPPNEDQRKLLESILRLTQEHAELKDQSYNKKLINPGNAAVTLDKIMLSSIYRDLPKLLSGEKKIDNCPMLLKTIIWCGVPELTHALKAILLSEPNLIKPEELEWLLELYASGDNTAELAQVWLDLQNANDNRELKRQYAHALLQQPKMEYLKEAVDPLLAQIRASHRSTKSSISLSEDRINSQIIERVHAPDTDWSLLSEILSAIDKEEEKDEYADLLAVWFGVKRMQDCPVLLWTVISSKNLNLKNNILDLLYRENNSELAKAFKQANNLIRYELLLVKSNQKPIEDCPDLLQAIVSDGDSALAQTLKTILEPVVGEQKLAWLLELYSSNAGAADLVRAWVDPDSPHKDPQQTKGYLDILLKQPNMKPLKIQVDQLHRDIAQGVSNGIIRAEEATTLENEVNQEIVHCVHQSLTPSAEPYQSAADLDDLKKNVEPAVAKTPRGKWASRILMGLGIALGIGCLIGLGLASGGVIPAAFAVGGVLFSVLPSALVGTAISCAMTSAGFSLHSWRNHKIGENEKIQKREKIHQDLHDTIQNIKQVVPGLIQHSVKNVDSPIHSSEASDTDSDRSDRLANSPYRSESPLSPTPASSSSSSSPIRNPAHSIYGFHSPKTSVKDLLNDIDSRNLFSLNSDC